MSKQVKLVLVFLPAFLIVGIFLFIRVVQYEPLYPDQTPLVDQERILQIPILPLDPIIGNPRAPKTVIAFADLGCEQCKIQHDLLDELQQQHPNQVKIIFKGLSVTRFPQDSTLAHRYAVCMHEQEKFEPFMQYAYVNFGNLSENVLNSIIERLEVDQEDFLACLESPLPDDYLETTKTIAQQIGIESVPAIFVNNKQIQLPNSTEQWETILGL